MGAEDVKIIIAWGLVRELEWKEDGSANGSAWATGSQTDFENGSSSATGIGIGFENGIVNAKRNQSFVGADPCVCPFLNLP